MKLSPREIVFLVLLFAIPLGMWFLVLKPRTRCIKQLDADTKTKERTLQELQIFRTMAEARLEGETTLLTRTVEKMRSRLIEPDNASKVTGDIAGLAAKHNLVHKYLPHYPIKVPGENDKVDAAWLSMLLELDGTFDDLYQFLQSLEQEPQIIRIDKMNINRVGATSEDRAPSRAPAADKDAGPEKVHAEIMLLIFFKPDSLRSEVKPNVSSGT